MKRCLSILILMVCACVVSAQDFHWWHSAADKPKSGNGPTIPTNGLISYWSFSDIASTTCVDSVDDNDAIELDTYHGIPTNGIKGLPDTAVYFDGGINSCFDMGNKANLCFSNSLTLSLWIQFIDANAAGSHAVIGKPESSSRGYGLWMNNGQLKGVIGDGSNDSWFNFNTSMTLTNLIWYYVALTFDGDTGKIYVDGVEQASYSKTCTIIQTANEFVMGAYSAGPNYYCPCVLDEVRAYNRGLSSNEVGIIYNAEKP